MDQLSSTLIPFAAMAVIFYFLLIRPQQQRMKAHRAMLENLRRGDTVVTAGGIVGRIAKPTTKEDPEVTVEIADNVQIKVVKSTLTEVRAKTQPVSTEDEK